MTQVEKLCLYPASRPEHSYLDDGDQNKNAKGTKRCVIKPKLKFKDYKHCLKAIQLKNKTNQLEKQ